MPGTFRERGVAVPFTSPMLAGARIRLLERKCDLVVPHPGGARGVYIFALASLTEFCAPTLHDLKLAERLQALREVTPACVRAASRAIALQGLAGRDAAASAGAADAAEEAARMAMQVAILSSSAPHGSTDASDASEPARLALMNLAARDNSTPEVIEDSLNRLCAHIVAAGLGVPSTAAPASAGRCATLLSHLAEAEQQVRAWMAGNGESAAASQVADAFKGVAAAGQLLLSQVLPIVADTADLLAGWATGPERLIQRLSRTDWLLDGWEHINLLWRLADGEARADTLAEISLILPPIPPEGDAWLGGAPALLAGLRHLKPSGASHRAFGRMPSEIVSLVARNERIRALSA